MTARRAALAAAALLALARPAAAQDVRIAGDTTSPAARLARDILARRTYLRFDRDTVLPASFHAPGDVVIYDADVRLEGTIDGSVAVVGGAFFIRPRATVRGDIAIVGGDVYASALAHTGHVLETTPGATVAMAGDTAVGDTGVYVARIIPAPQPSAFALLPRPLPSYDRVNGLTLGFGARVLPTRNDSGPRLEAWATWRFHNPDKLGGGARIAVPTGVANAWLNAEASRATWTNDAWQRGDLSNTLSVLITGRDYRDYWDADQLRVSLTRPVDRPLVAGEAWIAPTAGVLWSRDRSLAAHHVWSIWSSKDKDRPNPPILDGTIVSLFGGAELRWVGRLSSLTANAQVESSLPGPSVATFTQLVGEATYKATAFRTHTLNVYLRGATPFTSDAPPQRYEILGGPSTLPTLAVGHYRGDHLAYADARYGIPLPVALPFIGQPSLQFIYTAGAAWSGPVMPRWTQNPGLGLAFSLASVEAVVDPSASGFKPRIVFAASIPRVF